MNGSPFIPGSHPFEGGREQRRIALPRRSPPQPSAMSVDRGQLLLGQTLPDLLDMGCARAPNPQALNQWQGRRWRSLASPALRQAAEEIALGLVALGVHQGDRIPLVMHSDLDFCQVDLACLLAGLVDVPIDLTQTIENILFILNHTQAKVLMISNLDLLQQLTPYLWEASTLQRIIVAEVPPDWDEARKHLMQHAPPVGQSSPHDVPTPWECLHIPQFLGEATVDGPAACSVPACVQLLSLADVQAQGQAQWTIEAVEQLRNAIAPSDLATIIYIAGPTQRPHGVMLTHENIAANALTAFTSYPQLQAGADEVALLFLPLTHIFARVFLYGHLAYGHTVYLSDPNHLSKHLRKVRPTVMITVPRLLEKVYERLMERGSRLRGVDRQVFNWALSLARRFEVERSPQGLYALQLQLADALVFAKWRVGFGDRLKALICGGAALRPELVNLFTAAGLPLLQGYGLTETSGVVYYNRGGANRTGTVGLSIAGVEIALAADQEILIRAPFVMQGYYQDTPATQAVLDDHGWLHTGDLGVIDKDGFLSITGVKKPLFKLSTGKYVSSQVLEAAVAESPLVEVAVAVGAHQKFCGMLIFPNLDALRAIAQTANLDTSSPEWWQHPALLAHYQVAIDTANCHLPYWSTVRQFRLADPNRAPRPTHQNGGLRKDGTLNRVWVMDHYAAEIEALYQQPAVPPHSSEFMELLNLNLSNSPICPVHAKSLLHH